MKSTGGDDARMAIHLLHGKVGALLLISAQVVRPVSGG